MKKYFIKMFGFLVIQLLFTQQVNADELTMPELVTPGQYFTVSWDVTRGDYQHLSNTERLIHETISLERLSSPLNDWVQIDTFFTGSSLEQLLAEGEYEYRLRRHATIVDDEDGTEYTSTLTSTVLSSTLTVTSAKPSAPVNIASESISANSHVIGWDDDSVLVADVEYELQELTVEYTGGIYNYETIYKGADKSFQVEQTSGNYNYRVKSCFVALESICSGWSEVTSIAVINTPNDMQGVQLISVDSIDNSVFDFSLTQYSTGQFRLYFNAPSNVAYADINSYRVRISENGSEFKNFEEVGTTLNFDFSLGYYRQYNLPVGNYRFQIQACNLLCDCSEFVTALNQVEVLGVPDQANAPTASSIAGNGTLELNWQVPQGLMVTHYEIEQTDPAAYLWMSTEGSNLESSRLFEIVSSTSILMKRSLGAYRYRLRACNLSGCGPWSLDSNLVSVDSIGTPREFISSASTRYDSSNYLDNDGHYLLSWNDISDSVGETVTYKIVELSLNDSSTATYDINTPTVILNLTDKAEGQYRYTLQACTSLGCGDTTAAMDIHVEFSPATPTNFSAQYSVTSQGLSISWNAVATALTYDIARSSDAGATWNETYATVNTPEFFDTDIDLNNGVYYYRVRSCKTGCSDWSATPSSAQ